MKREFKIETRYLEFGTKGHTDILDLTPSIQNELTNSGIEEGNVLVSTIGSTSAITMIEFEPGLVKTDFPEMLNQLAPYGKNYKHNLTWGDDNGAAHLRASLIGGTETIPFEKGRLILGTWQQVIFLDFDTRARNRKIVVQIQGI